MIIWLASYPKSGNTWLRALLSSYLYSESGKFDFDLLNKIDAFPSERFFKNYPDKFEDPEETAKYWLDEQKKINKNKQFSIFKTHNAVCKIRGNRFTDNNNSLGAIYIIRDPRKVVTSVAHHYQITKDQALEFMLNEKKAIVSQNEGRYIGFQALFSWKLHQKSWIENKMFPVLVIRYEDLQDETFFTFKKVINFISRLTKSKMVFNKNKAKACIRECDFKKLSELEVKKGFAEAITKKGTTDKIKFFNLGKNNDYKNLLDKNLLSKMNTIFSSELLKYKYE